MSETVFLNQLPPAMVVEVVTLTPVGPKGGKGDKGDKGDPGSMSDAPADGVTYGRLNLSWTEVMPVTGATMTGPIMFAPGQKIDGGEF
jgi:hypothetical protein